jgi:hypothetical protein
VRVGVGRGDADRTQGLPLGPHNPSLRYPPHTRTGNPG